MTLLQKSSADGNSLQHLPFYPTANIPSFIPILPSFQLIERVFHHLCIASLDTNLSYLLWCFSLFMYPFYTVSPVSLPPCCFLPWAYECAYSLSRVRLFVTPWTVACQAPLSMGMLQARILEWVTMGTSRGSSQPRDQTQVSCIAGKFFTIWTTREAQSLWISSCFLSLKWKKGLLSSTQTLFPFTDNLLQRPVYEIITASLQSSLSLLYPLRSGFQPHLNCEPIPTGGRGDIPIARSNITLIYTLSLCHWALTTFLSKVPSSSLAPVTSLSPNFLLVCVLSHLVVSNPLWPIDYSQPVSSVHGISLARVLEWVAISSSRGFSWSRDWTHISSISLPLSHRRSPGIFLIQGLNPHLQHLYHWATGGAPSTSMQAHKLAIWVWYSALVQILFFCLLFSISKGLPWWLRW